GHGNRPLGAVDFHRLQRRFRFHRLGDGLGEAPDVVRGSGGWRFGLGFHELSTAVAGSDPGLRVEAARSPRSEGGGSRLLPVVPARHAWFKRRPFRNLLSPLSQAVSLYALSPRQPSSVFRFS